MLRNVQASLLKTSCNMEINQVRSIPPANIPVMKTFGNSASKKLFNAFSIFAYGKEKIFKNEFQKNRYENFNRVIRYLTQRSVFENLYELNPSDRFNNVLPPIYLKRYDRNPNKDEVTWVKSNNINEKEQENFTFHLAGKSFLSLENELIPPGNLPVDIFTEPGSCLLANLVYRHIGSTNKISESIEFKKNAEIEISTQQRSEMKARLKNRQAGLPPEQITAEKKSATLGNTGASALTSTSHGSPVEKSLWAWGDGQNYIQVCASEVLALPPEFMATLILDFANDEGMDVLSRTSASDPTPYNWREDKVLIPENDPALIVEIEKKIIKAGIDPNGAWTLRERAAYFAIVTQEYSILGKTKPGTAKLEEEKKQ